jgi:hypothetical protein
MTTLSDLEQRLRGLSHSEEAISEVQKFCAGLSGTKSRMEMFSQENAVVRRPIEHSVTARLGFDNNDDEFVLLQGDIVKTDAAYFLGERVVGSPKYAVLNSSCDLVPGRSTVSSVLRISAIRRTEDQAKEKLGTLVKFSRRDSMYMPVMPEDAADVVGNAILFDGICQIRTADLLLANRIASLSLVGWRIYASFARVVFTRANEREVRIRTAVENVPKLGLDLALDTIHKIV